MCLIKSLTLNQGLNLIQKKESQFLISSIALAKWLNIKWWRTQNHCQRSIRNWIMVTHTVTKQTIIKVVRIEFQNWINLHHLLVKVDKANLKIVSRQKASTLMTIKELLIIQSRALIKICKACLRLAKIIEWASIKVR